MKSLLISTTAIVLCVSMLLSFKTKVVINDESDFVVMKIIESVGSHHYLLLSYGNGKTEKIELEKNNGFEQISQNVETINTQLNKLKKKGYKLKSSTGGDIYSTHIFEKD